MTAPTSPLLALRAAILDALGADAALLTLMGGALRLHDEPPRGAPPVYAVFEDASARDDSVDGARRHAHALRIVVWGRPGSARPALEAAERVAALLHDAPLVLDGHRLVRLAAPAVEAGRDPRTNLARVAVVLDAVTEAL